MYVGVWVFIVFSKFQIWLFLIHCSSVVKNNALENFQAPCQWSFQHELELTHEVADTAVQ